MADDSWSPRLKSASFWPNTGTSISAATIMRWAPSTRVGAASGASKARGQEGVVRRRPDLGLDRGLPAPAPADERVYQPDMRTPSQRAQAREKAIVHQLDRKPPVDFGSENDSTPNFMRGDKNERPSSPGRSGACLHEDSSAAGCAWKIWQQGGCARSHTQRSAQQLSSAPCSP